MSTVHRRLRLPADYRSPAAARAAVRDVLIEADGSDLLDEALLLTTELSTNGVIHAGTDLDVDIAVDDRGVTVTVTDYRGGPIEASLLAPDEGSEHGRGLLLVDQFATSWGTTHDPTGKGVWFRLERGSPPARSRYGQPTRPRPASPEARPTGPADALVWLVHVPDDLRSRLTLPQLLSELLLRLCEVIDAPGGAIFLDRADGRGEHCVARQGTAGLPVGEAPDGLVDGLDAVDPAVPPAALTVPLPLPRPLSGRIELYTTDAQPDTEPGKAPDTTAPTATPTPSPTTPGQTPTGPTATGPTPSDATAPGPTPTGPTPSDATAPGAVPTGPAPSGATPFGLTPSDATPSDATTTGTTTTGTTTTGTTSSGATTSGMATSDTRAGGDGAPAGGTVTAGDVGAVPGDVVAVPGHVVAVPGGAVVGGPAGAVQGVGETWRPLAQLSAERMTIAVEHDRLRDDDRVRRSWLTYLAEAGELLAQSLDVSLTHALIPQLVVPQLGEWCALHTLDEYGDLRLAACGHADEAALPVLRQVLADDDTDVPERLAEAVTGGAAVTLPRPVEGVAVPLIARGGVLGTLSVGRPAGRLHAPDDVAVISDLARRAALALENARIHAERAQVSQDFQGALLPAELPAPEGIQFAAEYVPASTGTDVGGDFYDVVELGADSWLMCIGDVCGKGAQAAALTGLVRDVIRVLTRDGRPLDRIVELLNQTLLDQHDGTRYCTLAMAVVTRDADRGLDVELCLSGHDRPYLVHAEGDPEPVGACGTAVGLLDDVVVTPVKVRLAPGDALVFYTDGVTERRREGDLFGHRRLARELRRRGGVPAATIAARLTETVLGFSPDQPRDDIAVLVLRNQP